MSCSVQVRAKVSSSARIPGYFGLGVLLRLLIKALAGWLVCYVRERAGLVFAPRRLLRGPPLAAARTFYFLLIHSLPDETRFSA